MKKILQKIKQLNILLAASCLLIIATGSAEIVSSPSGELSVTPTSSFSPIETSTESAEQSRKLTQELEKKELPISEQSLFVNEDFNVKTDPEQTYALGHVSVKFKQTATESARAADISSIGGKIKMVTRSGVRILKVKEGEEQKAIDILMQDPNVEYAEKVGVMKSLGGLVGQAPGSGLGGIVGTCVPNDEWYCRDLQYNLAQIQAGSGWNLNKGGSNTVIAVIDSGINYNHPDLYSKIWKNPGESGGGKESNGIDDDQNSLVDDYMGWNYIYGNNTPMDDVTVSGVLRGHGTFVAGIAAASTNNYSGIAGINWYGKIMNLKTGSYTGVQVFPLMTAAIYYAVDNGADIINISAGGIGSINEEADLRAAVEYAQANNVVVVAAALYPLNKNDHNCFIGLPAGIPGVISVSAISTNPNGQVATCWNLNHHNVTWQKLQVSAPGANVYSTSIDGTITSLGYGEGPFTSWSTPVVSGIASILHNCIQGTDNFKYNKIIESLKNGGHDYGTPGWDSLYGYKSASLYYALDYYCY